MVYAGSYYDREDRLRSILFDEMKKQKIKSVMVTSIDMYRVELITKEKMETYCKGEETWGKYSVNDDLEFLFENIRLGEEPDEYVYSYFLPKLTEKELKLVEKRDPSYLLTFDSRNPDVNEAKMLLSESDSKYVTGFSSRKTFVIENSFENSSENAYEFSFENENSKHENSQHENLKRRKFV